MRKRHSYWKAGHLRESFLVFSRGRGEKDSRHDVRAAVIILIPEVRLREKLTTKKRGLREPQRSTRRRRPECTGLQEPSPVVPQTRRSILIRKWRDVHVLHMLFLA